MRVSLDYDKSLPLAERYKIKNKGGIITQGSLYHVSEALDDYIDRNWREFYTLRMGKGLSREQKIMARHILSDIVRMHNFKLLLESFVQ